MTEQDDTIRGLARLVRAAVFGNNSVTSDAEAVVTCLGIGPDDPVSADAIEAGLRKALGIDAPPADPRRVAFEWLITARSGTWGTLSGAEMDAVSRVLDLIDRIDRAATAAGEGNR
jgi:hypothetical protein